jgi:hypothetical protein
MVGAVDIKMHDNHRLLQIRNPWSKRGIPKQTFHSQNFGDDLTHGTFWLEYHAISQTFKTLYLNWNPRLFGFVAQRHLSFAPVGSDIDVGGNGQFVLSVEGCGVVWVVLERHYLGGSEGWEGYIGLALFPGDERIYSYSRPIYRVPTPLLPSSRPWSIFIVLVLLLFDALGLTLRRNTSTRIIQC